MPEGGSAVTIDEAVVGNPLSRSISSGSGGRGAVDVLAAAALAGQHVPLMPVTEQPHQQLSGAPPAPEAARLSSRDANWVRLKSTLPVARKSPTMNSR